MVTFNEEELKKALKRRAERLQKEKEVSSTPRISALTPEEQARSVPVENTKRYKEYQSSPERIKERRQDYPKTNVLDQATAGVIRPFERALFGRDEPSVLKAYQVPRELLTKKEKAAQFVGEGAGYAAEYLPMAKGAKLAQYLAKPLTKKLAKKTIAKKVKKKGFKAAAKRIAPKAAKEAAIVGALEGVESRGDPGAIATGLALGGVGGGLVHSAPPVYKALKKRGAKRRAIKRLKQNQAEFAQPRPPEPPKQVQAEFAQPRPFVGPSKPSPAFAFQDRLRPSKSPKQILAKQKPAFEPSVAGNKAAKDLTKDLWEEASEEVRDINYTAKKDMLKSRQMKVQGDYTELKLEFENLTNLKKKQTDKIGRPKNKEFSKYIAKEYKRVKEKLKLAEFNLNAVNKTIKNFKLKDVPDDIGMTSEVFADKMKAIGLNPKDVRGNFGLLESKRNMTELLDSVEKATKGQVKVGDLPIKLYEGLNKKQHLVANATKQIDEIKGLGVEGERLGYLLEGKLKPSSEQEIRAVELGRGFFDEARESARSLGFDVGYLEKYLPWKEKFPGLTERTYSAGRLPKDPKLGIAQKRIAKKAKPTYERDAYKLMDRYAREVGHGEMLNLIPQARKGVMQLKAMGHNGKAASIERWFGDVAGVGRDKGYKLFAEDFSSEATRKAAEIVEAMQLQRKDGWKLIYNEISNLMYKSWIGLNPKTWFKQYNQPRWVGAAEIGEKYIHHGTRAHRYGGTKVEALWNEVKDRALSPSLDIMEGQLGTTRATGKTRKLLDILEWPSKLGWKKFTKFDIRNRRVVFFGAYEQMMKKGITNEVMDGLLDSQKRMVNEAFKKGGAHEAAKTYGLVRTHRANYIYSPADKPLILQNIAGDYIPFTTWSRNQWNRYIGDIEKKNYKMVAKRLAYPAVYLTMWEIITGVKTPGAHPVTAMNPAYSIAPALTGPAESATFGNYKRAASQAASILPPVRAVQKLAKVAKKGPVKGLGFERSKLSPGVPGVVAGLVQGIGKLTEPNRKKRPKRRRRMNPKQPRRAVAQNGMFNEEELKKALKRRAERLERERAQ